MACFTGYSSLIVLCEGTGKTSEGRHQNLCQCIRHYEKSELYSSRKSLNEQHNQMLGYFYSDTKNKGLALNFHIVKKSV